MDTPRHWLILRLSALGDVLLASGVLQYWQTKYNWTFTVVTREIYAPLFYGHPAVKKTIGLTDPDLKFPKIIRVFRQIATDHRKDGLIDLHGTIRSCLLSLLWRGPVRYYLKYNLARRAFLLFRNAYFSNLLLRHNVPQRYALAVEKTVPARQKILPRIFIEHYEIVNARQSLYTYDPQAKPIALHPYAAHPGKTWQPVRWLELMRHLDQSGQPWFVIGNGDPLPIPQELDFTNRTSLRQSAALLSLAKTLVTGDSGPMHLATAVNTPIVALFGPTTAEWGFYPEGAHDIALEAKLSCRPCSLHGKKPCAADQNCMDLISVDNVLDALQLGSGLGGALPLQTSPAGGLFSDGGLCPPSPPKSASGKARR